MGMSTKRYLPASGTAGLARSLVRGKSLVPAPPPMTMPKVFLESSDSLSMEVKGAEGIDYFLMKYEVWASVSSRNDATGE